MIDANAEPTRFRRWVVLDIETVSTDPTSAKGGLDPISGKIICICLLIDDGTTVNEVAIASENEGEILTSFWGAIQSSDVLIGHNLYEFDIPYIRARSWILDIRPSRFIDMRKYYSVDLRDTMAIWTNWGFKKGVSLDTLGCALGCGQKTGHGEDVEQWWAARDLASVKGYCMEDVRLTYRVYCRLTYQQPRSKPETEASPSPQSASAAPNRRRGRKTPAVLPMKTPA